MIDTGSDTWRAVKAWADESIKAARDTLETDGVGERRADAARGYIAAVRSLLALAAPQPMIPTEDDYVDG